MKWVLAVFAIIGWCAVVAVIGAYIEIRLSEKKAAMTERSAVEKFRDFLEARGAGRLLEGETEEPPSVAVVRPTRDQIRGQIMDIVVETRGRWSLLQDDIESRVPMPEFDQMVISAGQRSRRSSSRAQGLRVTRRRPNTMNEQLPTREDIAYLIHLHAVGIADLGRGSLQFDSHAAADALIERGWVQVAVSKET